jgi:hypothetical protein
MTALQSKKRRIFPMKRLIILVTLVSFVFSIQIGYATPLTSTLKDQQDVAVTIRMWASSKITGSSNLSLESMS